MEINFPHRLLDVEINILIVMIQIAKVVTQMTVRAQRSNSKKRNKYKKVSGKRSRVKKRNSICLF